MANKPKHTVDSEKVKALILAMGDVIPQGTTLDEVVLAGLWFTASSVVQSKNCVVSQKECFDTLLETLKCMIKME